MFNLSLLSPDTFRSVRWPWLTRTPADLLLTAVLAAVLVVLLADTQHQTWLEAHDDLLRKELNVEQVTYTDDDQYIDYRVTPNFKRLGPRVGKLMPHVKKAIASAMGSELLAQLNEHQKVVLQIDGQDVEFDNEDLEVSIQAKEGWVAADDHALKQALQRARHKAEMMADTLDVDLGDVVNIEETTAPRYQPQMMMRAAEADSSGSSAEYRSGEISIDAGVSVIWEIDD